MRIYVGRFERCRMVWSRLRMSVAKTKPPACQSNPTAQKLLMALILIWVYSSVLSEFDGQNKTVLKDTLYAAGFGVEFSRVLIDPLRLGKSCVVLVKDETSSGDNWTIVRHYWSTQTGSNTQEKKVEAQHRDVESADWDSVQQGGAVYCITVWGRRSRRARTYSTP